jgi:hypothetical protein
MNEPAKRISIRPSGFIPSIAWLRQYPREWLRLM